LMKAMPADYNNARDLGSRIYTDYLLPFELAAVLLLLGMVAAIALVHRKTTNPKRMDPADQVKVRADQGRMRLVKMEAVKPQTESAEENEVSDDLYNILLTSFLKNFNEPNTQYKLLRNADRCLP